MRSLFKLIIFVGLFFFSFNAESSEENKKYCEEQYVEFFLEKIKAYKNYEKGLACAKEKGLPIFLYFTAKDERLREYEKSIFSNKKIKKLLTDNFFNIVLHVDSTTPLSNPEDKIIEFRGEKIDDLETEGNRNAILQLKFFEKLYQPLFVVIDADGKPILDSWEYEKNPEFFIYKLELALKIANE